MPRLKTRRQPIALVAAAAAVGALAMAAPSAAKTLRIGAQADAGTMDPHAQNIQTTISVLSMMYEALVTRDKSLAKAPQLATGWENVSPNEWRFTLRPNVKFHDGAAFGADDVAMSIARAQADTSQFKGFVGNIAETRIVDDLTIDLVTKEPDPLLLDKLGYIFIMDRDWAEANDVQRPQDLKQKEETYSVQNANGTGPYVLASREPDARTVLTRNPDYWGALDGDIDEIVFQPISSDPTRIAALVSGELDLVTAIPSQNVAQLEANPDIKLEITDEFRTLFYAFDVGSEVIKHGNAGGTNPFSDRRVRQAVNLALDSEAIVRTVMRGYATPTGQILAPGNVGYDAELDALSGYDPDAAKGLLAEAGYPDGFSFTLDCPNNRYINDEAICRAAAAMLAQVGLDVSLNLMPRAVYFGQRLWNRDSTMFLMGFNSPYFDGTYMAETMVMTTTEGSEGIYNYSLNSDLELDAAIRDARGTLDVDERHKKLQAVFRSIKEDVLYAPLHHQVLVYAMRPNVGVQIRPDNWLEIRGVTMD